MKKKTHPPKKATGRLAAAMTQSPERFRSAEQLSTYIPFSVNAIYRMVSNGTIPHIKKGRRVLFDTRAIDAWLHRDSVRAKAS